MIRPVAELIVMLERECLAVDKAIAARAWPDCEASWRRQRLLTHELDISLRENPADAPGARKRIERLTNYREAQLKRLREFNSAVAARIAQMGRFQKFSKTVATERRSSLLDVTS